MTIERAIELIRSEMIECEEDIKCRCEHNMWLDDWQREEYEEVQKAYKIALKCMENCEIVYGKVYVEVLKDEPKKD